jgi:hypothetical protein
MTTGTNDSTMISRIAAFRSLFSGRTDVYGTYDPRTGQVRQIKAPVTDRVIRAHLTGRQPFGVYLLTEDRVSAAVVDFDVPDLDPVLTFVDHAQGYELACYIERSKSKGHHVWLFFGGAGLPAWKPRRVLRHLLVEIGEPDVEVFPKQDRLDGQCRYGNFINAPLFGRLVPEGRTAFVSRRDPHRPLEDQWGFLAEITRISETQLDEIIAVNELASAPLPLAPIAREDAAQPVSARGLGLLPCGVRMLSEGVEHLQRVSCFRLAIQLKLAGLPPDQTAAALERWSHRNRPRDGKRLITFDEIRAQVDHAYKRDYRSYGCETEAVRPFCHAGCRLYSGRQDSSSLARRPTGRKLDADTDERSATMSNERTRPVQKFRCRNLTLAVWAHQSERDGHAITQHSITLNKHYRDPQTSEWKDSRTFFPDDLPRLRLLLDKAYELLLLRDPTPANNSEYGQRDNAEHGSK